MATSGSGHTAIQNLFHRESDHLQLIEFYQNSSNLEEPSDIEKVLPRFPLPLTSSQIEQLKERVPFDSLSEHDGVDIYVKVLDFVKSCR